MFKDEEVTTMATAQEDERSWCSCQTCESVRETIRKIFIVIDKYGWLLDAYIVDFYVDHLWNRLPNSWINFIEDITPKELGSWILNERPSNRVCPLSLLALRQVGKILQINRDHTSETVLQCQNIKNKIKKPNQSGRPSSSNQKEEKRGFSNYSKLQNLLSKHVKPKKKHEINIMAKIIVDCAELGNCECVVDVGAGLGHLARTLAYEYEMCVTCVEQQSLLSEQARKLDTQFESIARKYVPDIQAQKPHHVSIKIERNTSDLSLLNQNLKNEFKLNRELSGFGLIGLHPCGDLATNLLECYAESDQAKFICIAGCCYMKLTIGSQSYPLSKYLRSFEINELSYTALEVACHAVENHCEKLKSAEYWNLKIHAYRAALESILVARSPSLSHSHLKSIKLRENTTFKEYCIAATENLFQTELNSLSLEEIENPRITGLLKNWERVMIFGSLRLMLAPLVESVILLDRFLYLSEKNLSPKLKAVFDPLLSPRNFVLTSVK